VRSASGAPQGNLPSKLCLLRAVPGPRNVAKSLIAYRAVRLCRYISKAGSKKIMIQTAAMGRVVSTVLSKDVPAVQLLPQSRLPSMYR